MQARPRSFSAETAEPLGRRRRRRGLVAAAERQAHAGSFGIGTNGIPLNLVAASSRTFATFPLTQRRDFGTQSAPSPSWTDARSTRPTRWARRRRARYASSAPPPPRGGRGGRR